MHLISPLCVLLLASASPSALLQTSQGEAASHLAGSAWRMQIIATQHSDVDGELHHLGLRGAAAPVVLVFLDPASPAAQASLAELKSLAPRATSSGVEFYGVLSSAAVSAVEARAYRDRNQLNFPLLFDATGELATRLQPTRLPEGFVLSKYDELVYRGGIEGDPAAGRHDLREAIDAQLAGQRPESAFEEATGDLFERWPDNLNELALTYNRDIAPIMEASCVECHRPGDVGPFALDNYASLKRRARMVLFACEARSMPPWLADPEVNIFREQRSISERQIEIIRSWMAAQSPEGKPEDLLPRRKRHESGWRLGEPDLIVTLPAFDLPAEGADVFQNFVLPSELSETRLITGIEFKPKAKSVVHHMQLALDLSGRARELDAADPGVGFSAFGPGVPAGEKGDSLTSMDFPMVRAWVPGQLPYKMPEGLGVPLAAGSDFVITTHYHLDGTATTDQSQIGLYFGDATVRRDILLGTMLTNQLQIPAGERNYVRHVQCILPAAATFLNLTPHMHNLGVAVSVFATAPGEQRRHLLEIPRWDYRWQNTYTFHEPLFLPKGTLIESIHTYDNSADNPDNPSDPPQDVSVGWYTLDEMCILYFNFVPLNNPKQRQAFFLDLPTTLQGE